LINLSDGVDNLGGMDFILPLFMLLAWFIIFAGLIKGAASLGKISYFTATVPYILITVLIVRCSLLDGAKFGIDFYVGSFDFSNFGSAELWKDAVSFEKRFSKSRQKYILFNS
jgi:SNF family Na+-dependent transporter